MLAGWIYRMLPERVPCAMNRRCLLCSFRMVCEALVSSSSLEWERTQLWALTFQLIRKIIGGVDYKVSQSVRYLLK